jgi:hypothetical protein
LIDELPEFRTRSFNAVSSCPPADSMALRGDLGEMPDATGKYTPCSTRNTHPPPIVDHAAARLRALAALSAVRTHS